MASQGHANCLHAHQVLGNFSVNENGVYRDDRRMRRTFVEPDDDVRNMNLLEGIDDYDRALARVELGQGKQPSSMTSLLEWLRDHRGELLEHEILKISKTDQVRRLDIDFVGKRGVFCRLLRALETIYRMDVLVTLCNGTYYIEILRDADETTALKESYYCLQNLRRHVTLVDGLHPDITGHDCSFYCSVLRTRCGDHKIILSSGVQAERDNSRPPPRNSVDFKIRQRITTRQARRNFKRYTTLKWWSQAVVAGIPEILCGWRDYFNEKPILSSVELMKTDELPRRAPKMKGGRRFWEAEACLDTFHTLLANIKDLIKEDDPRAVYHLELPEVTKLGKGVKSRLQARRFNLLGRREDDYVILPDWYLRDVLKIQDD